MIKRITAFILSAVLMLSTFVWSFAYESWVYCDIPIILISGDATEIVDKDDNMAFKTSEAAAILKRIIPEGTEIGDFLKEFLFEICKKYMVGWAKNDFTDYFDYIYTTLEPAMRQARLDCNGEPSNGSKLCSDTQVVTDRNQYVKRDILHTNCYIFYYDWRLDPLETADTLNNYIKQVKKTTGYDKVGIICRCLGANTFLSYVAKYGMGDICGVGFDGIVANGCELLSEPISGKFDLNMNAINRLITDMDGCKMVDLDDTVLGITQNLAASDILDLIWGWLTFFNFDKIEPGVTSAVALATFFTWPNYWAAVSAEDYQTALEYVFGPVGSEKREEYKGLIQKLDAYDKTVRQHIPELMKEINDNANLAIIAKYGTQLSVLSQSQSNIGDQMTSVNRASFGATTGTIYETLSSEYIEKQVAAGKGKYLSPDRQIDASTCMFPDQTFFIKGASHSFWTCEEMATLVKVISADKQLTIDDLPECHFMVFDYETEKASEMTPENMMCENWSADSKENKFTPFTNIKAIINLIKIVFTMLQSE